MSALVSIVATTTGVAALLMWSRRHRFLGPVALALAVRLVVMIVAHEASVRAGDQGFFAMDDAGYFQRARALGSDWSTGEWHDPSAARYGGTYMFGYQALLGALFALAGTSLLFGKAVNVLAGTATVLISGLLARRLFGEKTATKVGWICAVLPTAVWWSVTLTKEPTATLAFAIAVLGVVTLPDRRAVAALCGSLTWLLLVRPSAVVALGLAVVVTEALSWMAGDRTAPRRFAMTTTLTIAVLGIALLVTSGGRPASVMSQYWSTADSMVAFYGGGLEHMPRNVVKSLLAPFPWSFDADTRNWDRALYPGMWVLYVLYVLALIGAWRGRHRRDLRLVVGAVLAVVLVNAFVVGFPFRQRTLVEPLIVVIAAAQWQGISRSGRMGRRHSEPWAGSHHDPHVGGAAHW